MLDEIQRLIGERPKCEFQIPRPGDQLVYVTDFRKFQRDTGWKPRMTVHQTLESIYEWWKEQQEIEPSFIRPEMMSLSAVDQDRRVAS